MSTRANSSQAIAKTKRVGLRTCRPILYGSVARWLGKSAQPDRTHKWCVYVRGAKNEDLSFMIKKVVFNLHQSFEKPQRVIDRPPFEVSEVGWGEFDIGIKVHFVDTTEKPVQFFHSLQLYPADRTQLSTKRPVVSEHYDEIIFTNPREGFFQRLQQFAPAPTLTIDPPPGCPQDAAPVFNERAEIQRIDGAHTRVRNEILTVLDVFDRYDAEAKQLERQIAALLESGGHDPDDDDDNDGLGERRSPFGNIVAAPFSSSQITADDDADDDDDDDSEHSTTTVKISAADLRAVAASEPPPPRPILASAQLK
jgi:YEATS family